MSVVRLGGGISSVRGPSDKPSDASSSGIARTTAAMFAVSGTYTFSALRCLLSFLPCSMSTKYVREPSLLSMV